MNKEIINKLQLILEETGEWLLHQTVLVSSHKTANDLLTANDLQTEKLLIEKISKLLPTANIVSEETKADNELTGLTVVIDPIDGTCNYAVGCDRFGLQIAVFEDTECIASILHFPKQQETIYAIRGEGAYLGEKRLFIDQATTSSDGILLISDYYPNIPISMDIQFDLIKRLQPTFLKTRHLGAACVDFASIAKREAIAYICYYSKLWDIAPGLLIAKEAGACCSYIDGSLYEYEAAGLVVANNEKNLKIITDAYKTIRN